MGKKYKLENFEKLPSNCHAHIVCVVWVLIWDHWIAPDNLTGHNEDLSGADFDCDVVGSLVVGVVVRVTENLRVAHQNQKL